MKKILWLLLWGFVCLLPLGCGKEETLEPTPTPTENEYIVNLNDNIVKCIRIGILHFVEVGCLLRI